MACTWVPLESGWQRDPSPLTTALGDSFFLTCKPADSIANYNNRVVTHDNTIAIAFSLICTRDNTVANYNNGVVMPDNTVAIAISLVRMPDNTIANYRNRVVGHHNSMYARAHKVVTAHNSPETGA